MAKILTFEIPEKEYQDFEAFLDSCLVEMRRSREKMQEDQKEIDRLKRESSKISADTQRILDELERKWLKAA